MAGPNDPDRLRAKRQAAADERRQRELRQSAGPRLVEAVNRALGQSLTVDDFMARIDVADALVWPKRIEDAPGLVASYLDRTSAEKLLVCLGTQIGSLNGFIGFHDKAYLGFARVEKVDSMALLAIADESKDSVLFFVDQPKGVVLVDGYEDPGKRPYSLVVQGDPLIAAATVCFDER